MHFSASAPDSSTFSDMRAMSILGVNGGVAAIPAYSAEFSHVGGCLGHFSQGDDRRTKPKFSTIDLAAKL